MKGFEREDLWFSLCGLNCGLCPMRLGNYCPGCGGGAGNASCKIAGCSLKHGGMEYCFQCREFPCGHYDHIDEFDSFITHQRRKADLEKVRRVGLEAYRREQMERAEILRRLLENYNNGRQKTLFCLAANLLELESLRKIGKDLEQSGNTAKVKSAQAAELLQAAAEAQGVVLKLRKKRNG